MSAPTQSIKSGVGPRAAWRPWLMRSLPLRFAVVLICLLWSIPTLGLLISSFRPAQAITTTGWWDAILNPLAVGQWTLNNYSQVIDGQGMGNAFINSLIVTLPSTLIPITIAAFAAYAFAWIRFPFRGLLFAIVVGLLVVPLQMTLIPVLQRYSELGSTAPSWASGSRIPASDCRWPSSCSTTTSAAAARSLRVGGHRRGVPLPGLHLDRGAALDTSHRSIRHLPVPVGLE